MAIVKTKKVLTQRIVEEEKINKVILELDMDEIAFLCLILNRIGGSPTQSLRYYEEKLRNAIMQAGVPMYFEGYDDLKQFIRADIYFNDGPNRINIK